MNEMLSFILSGQLKVRLNLFLLEDIPADIFLIAGVTLQSNSGQLSLATKLARNQARDKCHCYYNTAQNGLIQGGAKSSLTMFNMNSTILPLWCYRWCNLEHYLAKSFKKKEGVINLRHPSSQGG